MLESALGNGDSRRFSLESDQSSSNILVYSVQTNWPHWCSVNLMCSEDCDSADYFRNQHLNVKKRKMVAEQQIAFPQICCSIGSQAFLFLKN